MFHLPLDETIFAPSVVSLSTGLNANYLSPKEDFVDEAAEEAAKWAAEQRTKALDERPGDYVAKADGVGYMENVDGHQVKKTIEGYTQNAEQNESTIWQRVKKAKGE